jgi:phosphotransferase system  glucose/maltose/N-acetylglucosamine-specific IIC component
MNNDTTKLFRATKFMVLYPAVYVILTLPIAVGRMVVMTGTDMPDTFFCVAGTLLTSCGWIDALLYTLTRRVLVSNELSVRHHTYNPNVTAVTADVTRPGDDLGLQSIPKDATTGMARTVTIVGGAGNRISRLIDHRRRSIIQERHNLDTLRESSCLGSQDSIIKAGPTSNAIGIVTETRIQVESASYDENSNDTDIESRLQRRNQSDSEFSMASLEGMRQV